MLPFTLYNDFYIGEDADVVIVAGCGIHNHGEGASRHDGVHTFHVGKNARVKYVEKHYGEGDGNGKNVMNPETVARTWGRTALRHGAHTGRNRETRGRGPATYPSPNRGWERIQL